MRYRILGRTGLRVSVIGLGTWQFGGEWGRDFSQADADAILDAASGSGINLIDTAECYGENLSATTSRATTAHAGWWPPSLATISTAS
jgi:aryl-alcohol dehydrogenase-like predicted oxidoreductase